MKQLQNIRHIKINPIRLMILFTSITFLLFVPIKPAAAEVNTVYRDGFFCYIITSEEHKEVKLVGIECQDKPEELVIPGMVDINNVPYTVAAMDVNAEYCADDAYTAFFSGVVKLKFDDTFTGTVSNPTFAFRNLSTMEFTGKKVPESVIVTVSNRSENLDILFIVPDGMTEEYENVISESISYYNGSDLYEQDIILAPTIVTSSRDAVEYGCFSHNGLIYQVISSAEKETGKVQLIGITCAQSSSYLSLPEQVTKNGYNYKLTKLCKFSLVQYRAKVIIVPDTVTEMDSAVFDKHVELLFLSKNCKVIPPYLITDENDESNLRFVSVPEGVTTISAKAFSGITKNTASIILPASLNALGKQALYDFKLVTFLSEKPISNIAVAVRAGATVKVKAFSISSYQSVLNKVTITAAKDITKAAELSVNVSAIKLSTFETRALTGALSKGANETIYWLSSDPDIFDISSKGVINPKKAGTAYAVAYTRTSGLHKAVKITVTYETFTSGLYQFRISNALNQTVNLYSINPKESTLQINIPEKISYKNKFYTVTEVIADPEDTSVPLINDCLDNNVQEIIFPKTITGTIGYLGTMKHIKRITFLGKAPASIRDWYADGGLLAFQAVIYVPKNCVEAYTSALWTLQDYDTYSVKHYGCWMDYNIVEAGCDELARFVKDGILYHVTKSGGTKNGTVAVKGADVTLKEIVIGTTVTNGKYTYDITEIAPYAFLNSNAEKITIPASVTKIADNAFGSLTEVIYEKQ